MAKLSLLFCAPLRDQLSMQSFLRLRARSAKAKYLATLTPFVTIAGPHRL
jgi:hypothetical protein